MKVIYHHDYNDKVNNTCEIKFDSTTGINDKIVTT